MKIIYIIYLIGIIIQLTYIFVRKLYLTAFSEIRSRYPEIPTFIPIITILIGTIIYVFSWPIVAYSIVETIKRTFYEDKEDN